MLSQAVSFLYSAFGEKLREKFGYISLNFMKLYYFIVIIIIIIIIININNSINKGRALTAMLNSVLWNRQITRKKLIKLLIENKLIICALRNLHYEIS